MLENQEISTGLVFLGDVNNGRHETVQSDEMSAEAQYLRDIGRYNLLTAEEELTLAESRGIGEAARDQMNTLPLGDSRRTFYEPLARVGASARKRLI